MITSKKIAASVLGKIHTAELDENSVNDDPLKEFGEWLNEAENSGLFNYPAAMTLSTASKKGIPSSRVVLLKEFGEEGFVFFTNYKSPKGIDLEDNPIAVMNFYWPVLEWQVNISGFVEKILESESNKYFNSRPRGSQIGAWASPQSELVKSREHLDKNYDQYSNLFQGKDVERPDNWGGYRLKPDKMEFWKARADRFHDRVQYVLIKNVGWEKHRVAP